MSVEVRVFVNLETKEKIYKGGDHMCPMDGFVCFHNSLLICGRLGKATLGGGNKAGLFQVGSPHALSHLSSGPCGKADMNGTLLGSDDGLFGTGCIGSDEPSGKAECAFHRRAGLLHWHR